MRFSSCRILRRWLFLLTSSWAYRRYFSFSAITASFNLLAFTALSVIFSRIIISHLKNSQPTYSWFRSSWWVHPSSLQAQLLVFRTPFFHLLKFLFTSAISVYPWSPVLQIPKSSKIFLIILTFAFVLIKLTLWVFRRPLIFLSWMISMLRWVIPVLKGLI